MAKYKSLLVSARIVSAGRKRKCYHSPKHAITKGDLCLEVKDGLNWQGYCLSCAAEMVDVATSGLRSIEEKVKSKNS